MKRLRNRYEEICQSRFLSAFTLIELLLVVIIMGVIAGLVIPNFGPTFSNFQLRETAENIAHLMRYAQSRAIIKNTSHALEFDASYLTYRILQVDSKDIGNLGKNSFESIQSRFGRNFKIPKEVNIQSDSRFVIFYPNGKIDKINIYLSNNQDNHFTVSTKEQIGHVQIFDFKAE